MSRKWTENGGQKVPKTLSETRSNKYAKKVAPGGHSTLWVLTFWAPGLPGGGSPPYMSERPPGSTTRGSSLDVAPLVSTSGPLVDHSRPLQTTSDTTSRHFTPLQTSPDHF